MSTAAMSTTTPRAQLLTKTVLTDVIPSLMVVEQGVTAHEATAEFAGRVCYDSLHKPNPATRANRDYLGHIIGERHFSVLAHTSIAVLLQGVSRSLTHELIRSVFLAYSQESQRYVRPALELQPVIPPDASPQEALDLLEGFPAALERYWAAFDTAVARAIGDGLTQRDARKKAAAVARAWLPNATPTRLVLSGNLRAWRDFFAQRATEEAEAEIREVSRELLVLVGGEAPAVFADQLADLHATA